MSITPQGLVYLAGPITGCTFDDAVDWRDAVTVELESVGIRALSPMRYKSYLLGEGDRLQDCYDQNIGVLSTGKGITTRDRWDCQRSDLVLVNLIGSERVSIGTMIEFGWADAARRPVIVAMDSDNIHQHSMVREIAGFILPTLEQAVDVTKALLLTGEAAA